MGIAGRGRAVPRRGPAGHEELLGRLAGALAAGRVDPADVERLLAGGGGPPRGRAGAAGVLAMLGALVMLSGLAIAFATVFDDLPLALRVGGPFAFPAAAAAGCAWLARRGSPRWQPDLAGLVAVVAYGGACAASGWASGLVGTGREGAAFVLVAAAPAAAMVAALYRATGSDLLLWTGGPAAPAAAGIAAAELAGVLDEGRAPWIVLAEAGLAAAAGALLLRRGGRDARGAFLWAALGAYAAVLVSPDDLDRFGVWHLVLAAAVVAAFLVAAAIGSNGLIWVAAAGGGLWVALIAAVVGSATGAALAVVMSGVGLLALALLVGRLRRRPGRTRRAG